MKPTKINESHGRQKSSSRAKKIHTKELHHFSTHYYDNFVNQRRINNTIHWVLHNPEQNLKSASYVRLNIYQNGWNTKGIAPKWRIHSAKIKTVNDYRSNHNIIIFFIKTVYIVAITLWKFKMAAGCHVGFLNLQYIAQIFANQILKKTS